ncbi:MAG: hypothetical protein JW915_21635, partial [Chitinispirillaceae bacterium]|nr:hypothetical protein [Chitinispirillaceae bacterium]
PHPTSTQLSDRLDPPLHWKMERGKKNKNKNKNTSQVLAPFLHEWREAIAYSAVLESFVKNAANTNQMHTHKELNGIWKAFPLLF